MRYKIGSISLCLNNLPQLWEQSVLCDFFTTEYSENALTVNIVYRETLTYQVEKFRVLNFYEQVFRYESEVFLANKDMSVCTVLGCSDMMNFMILLNHIFYSNAIRYHMIQFHSSLVQWQDHGIMFIGPSGIGKTTQAELWEKYQNAEIINGDLVFVQKKDDDFWGWGTPWHGSSPYCLNKSVSISAIIVLKQDKENKIRRLNGLEMVSEVGKNLFYPQWVDKGTEMALDILNQLLQKVPVYELTNRADKESVELVKQEIIGHE